MGQKTILRTQQHLSLLDFFGDRIVERGLSPPRSPDFTTPDFFPWIFFKKRVFNICCCYAMCTVFLDIWKIKNNKYFTELACLFYSTPCSFSYVTGHYNLLWGLAFSVIRFHSALSSHCFLHRLIPHYLHIFFDIYNPSLPWSPSNSRTYRFPL